MIPAMVSTTVDGITNEYIAHQCQVTGQENSFLAGSS